VKNGMSLPSSQLSREEEQMAVTGAKKMAGRARTRRGAQGEMQKSSSNNTRGIRE
jgi:hypothetical protein